MKLRNKLKEDLQCFEIKLNKNTWLWLERSEAFEHHEFFNCELHCKNSYFEETLIEMDFLLLHGDESLKQIKHMAMQALVKLNVSDKQLADNVYMQCNDLQYYITRKNALKFVEQAHGFGFTNAILNLLGYYDKLDMIQEMGF